MTPSPRATTPLRQRMIEDTKIRNLSPHTIQAYVDRVAAFAKHFGKSPQLLGPKEVRLTSFSSSRRSVSFGAITAKQSAPSDFSTA
jgi:hypothetical protein